MHAVQCEGMQGSVKRLCLALLPEPLEYFLRTCWNGCCDDPSVLIHVHVAVNLPVLAHLVQVYLMLTLNRVSSH